MALEDKIPEIPKEDIWMIIQINYMQTDKGVYEFLKALKEFEDLDSENYL